METRAARFIKPRALRAGGRVALVAPAGPVSADRVAASQARCAEFGLEPVTYPSAYERTGYLAGADELRLGDLQAALDDPAIDAVWALRGGYGTTRILHRVNLARQKTTPKPYIGFSDNTAVHLAHFHSGVVSFHAPHPGGAFPDASRTAFEHVLFCTEPAGLLPLRAEDAPPRALVGGRTEAPLVGGNLALLAALCGTRYAPHARGCILFVEDVGETAYRVDRMLVQLRDAGALDDVKGLALGRFTEAPEAEPDALPRLLQAFSHELGVPAVINFPIGHIEHNWTLPLGTRARLDADAATLEIVEPAVA